MINYMVEMIEQIYENGGFSFILGITKIEYKVNKQRELSIKLIPNMNNEKDYVIYTDDEYINIFLAIIVANSLEYGSNVIIGEFKQNDKTKCFNEKIINKLFCIYRLMISDNRKVMKDIIIDEEPKDYYNILVNNYAHLNIPITTDYDLETIADLLDIMYDEFTEKLNQGTIIWNKLNYNGNSDYVNDFFVKEWNDFCKEDYLIEIKNNDNNMKEKNGIEQLLSSITKSTLYLDNKQAVIDTELLDKENISYEFIDERRFKVNPAVGRDKEIRNLGAILSSPSYSAILIGAPGVGKTAIVEGLAYRIQNNEIGENLKNKKIIKISPTNLVSDTKLIGIFEKKMETIIEFLKNNPDVILYIDELHTAKGAGTHSKSDTDMLDILKPYIENGHIKMIGATTTYEYDEFIKPDSAFASRFKNVNVKELNPVVLKEVIESNITKFESLTDIEFAESAKIGEDIIDILIELTKINHQVYNDKRYNPRFILSIIEMAFGFASYDKVETVGISYICEAIEIESNLNESAKKNAIDKLKLLNNSSKRFSNITSFKKYVKKLED